LLFQELERLLVLPGKEAINFQKESFCKIKSNNLCHLTNEKTLIETLASGIPLPPNPVAGVPFKEDITDDKIGSTREATASSGFE
jgi:hypothetical protein